MRFDVDLQKTSQNNTMPRSSSQDQINVKFLRVMMELRLTLQSEDIPEDLHVLMVGYKHKQSTGYLRAKAFCRKEKYVEFSKGVIRLTPQGIAAGPQDVDPPTDNTEIQSRLYDLVLQQDKKIPKDKCRIIWNILLDGQEHTREELQMAADYKHPSSTGMLKIIKAFKDLNLIEKGSSKNTLKFTKLLFQFAPDS